MKMKLSLNYIASNFITHPLTFALLTVVFGIIERLQDKIVVPRSQVMSPFKQTLK